MITAELALELAEQHERARIEVKPIDPITVEPANNFRVTLFPNCC